MNNINRAYLKETVRDLVELLPFPVSGVSSVCNVDGDNYLFQRDGDAYRYNPLSGEAVNITSHKHIETETVTGFICKKLSSGKLISPTYSEILVIDPKNISDIPNTTNPLITVSEVTINGESRFVNFENPLMLNSEERNITLRINSHSYTEPNLNSFKYRMIGEHDWIELPNHKSTVVYSMLDYGNHTLEVQGSNNSGLWSDTKTILIKVDTPLYLTKMAYFLYALIVILLVYIAGRTRSKNKQKIQKLRKEQITVLEEANKNLMSAKNNAVEQKNKAIEANYEKNRFLGNISHELRTPLTGIQGMIELINHTQLTENQLKYLKVCSGCTIQMINHVNALLDLANLKSGKFDLQLSLFSLKDWSKEIQLLVCSQYLNSSTQYSFNNGFLELDENVGVYTDPEALKQVVLNLTGNALKFSEKENVDINLSHKIFNERFLIEVTVSDSGKGIPKDKLDLIFEDFTQLENLETTNKSGSGLGLSICKNLMKDLGGEINVSSTVGVGTIFKIKLAVEHQKEGCFDTNGPILDKKVSESIKSVNCRG